MIVRDFEINADGVIILPSIQVIHPTTPLDRTQLVQFMDLVIENLSLILGFVLAHLANNHVQSFSGLDVFVSEFTPERLGEKHVRFSRAVMMGTAPTPLG